MKNNPWNRNGQRMNKKVSSLLAVVIISCALVTVFLVGPSLTLPQQPQHELDFTVSGKNDCLRFLNSTVQTVYVPFRTGANEQWQLTINSTKMPGGTNGWTDVYIYNGYWDTGSNHTTMSEDLYPILSDIKSADAQIKGNTPYTQTFGGSAPESYTVFFIFPPGGQATFHITLKQV
jgi:hypothetical protein